MGRISVPFLCKQFLSRQEKKSLILIFSGHVRAGLGQHPRWERCWRGVFKIQIKVSWLRYTMTKSIIAFIFSRSLLKFAIERTPSPKKGHLLAESEDSDDGILETSKL